MNNKNLSLKLLFEELEVPQIIINHFNDAFIVSRKVLTDDSMELFIYKDTIIDYYVYRSLMKHLRNYSEMTFSFRFRFPALVQTKNYFEIVIHLVNQILEQELLDSSTLNYKIRYEDEIITATLLESDYLSNERQLELIKSIVSIFSFEIKYEIISETESSDNNLEIEEISSDNNLNNTDDKEFIFTGLLYGVDDKKLNIIYLRDSKEKTLKLFFKDVETKVLYEGEYNVTSISDDDLENMIKNLSYYEVRAKVSSSSEVGTFIKILELKRSEYKEEYIDDAPNKRIELHAHSKMSLKDGVIGASELVNIAYKYRHDAITLLDHHAVQAFPEFQDAIASVNKSGVHKIKGLFGSELYVIDPQKSPFSNHQSYDFEKATYVILDLETTSLSPEHGEIIEFSAVKKTLDRDISELNLLIKIDHELSAFTTEKTSITNELLDKKGIDLKTALVQISEFIKDSVIVAHNVTFDYNFLAVNFRNHLKVKLDNPYIDTILLARVLLKNEKIDRFSLKHVASFFQIPYDDLRAHRANYDTMVLEEVFVQLATRALRIIKEDLNSDLEYLFSGERNISTKDIENYFCEEENYSTSYPTHISVLAKNDVGIKSLYQIISISNIEYISRIPKIPRKILDSKRSDLLIGSCCYQNEVFEAAIYSTNEKLEELMKYYDYIEVQPPSCYTHLLELNKIDSSDVIIKALTKIIEIAKKLGKTVVATGDVHYAKKEDKLVRSIYVNARFKKEEGQKEADMLHPLINHSRIYELPDQHFRTTSKMLEEFSFLDEKTRVEIVITNPKYIASLIDNLKPIPKTLHSPEIKDSYDKLLEKVNMRSYELYGDNVDNNLKTRINLELETIEKYKYSLVYNTCADLVKHFEDQGYLVGSRGSVGSSFVAYLSGISEVNPLAPNYLCPKCKHFEFGTGGKIGNGWDLGKKKCPKCNTVMKSSGTNIPFETFLDIEGKKIPDIDLNFSEEVQKEAHDYIRNIFNSGVKNGLTGDKVFRAGTIGTIQKKMAIGIVKQFFEKLRPNKPFNNAEIQYYAYKAEGVKRSTGQHPGGLVVIPEASDIEDFTPVQFPADDNEKALTTHIDYDSLHDALLKFDVLGHRDPTVLRYLEQTTGYHAKDIDLTDKSVISLFTDNKVLNLKGIVPNWKKIGTIGLPEFGTKVARGILEGVKPKTTAQIIMCSGLSHGTNVWFRNAQDAIKSGVSVDEIIACRDDIMLYLQDKGFDKTTAFDIMELVRKGKFKANCDKYLEEMREKLPNWYIESCLKIKYLFPKAHAAAYVMMALRIGWYKINYPLEFYSSYFTFRVKRHILDLYLASENEIVRRIEEINGLIRSKQSKKIDEDELMDLEVVLEMRYRGYKILKCDINKSLSTEFVIDYSNKGLIAPFTAVDSLGEKIANSIVEQRNLRVFSSEDDFKKRTGISKNAIAILKQIKSLDTFQDYYQEMLDI